MYGVSQYEPTPAAVTLDIEKAFDTFSWRFLQEVLTSMHFGPYYIHWIRTLYNDPKARVKIGRVISDSFEIHRGARLVCPLSPVIFALAIEPLACHLRLQAQDWGIALSGTSHIISLYADDALI